MFSQPWLKRDDISHLRCAEKDEFFGGDESVEVFYPKVHPSAHARPVFKSHFIVRTSDESEESNEVSELFCEPSMSPHLCYIQPPRPKAYVLFYLLPSWYKHYR